MKPESLNLLTELTKLLKKYGAEPFYELADELKSDLFREKLTDVLNTVATAGRKMGFDQPRIKRTTSERNSFAQLAQKEPEKAQLLKAFHEALNAKSILPTLADLKSFTMEFGLPELKTEGRLKAIPSLMRALMSVSLDDLKAKLLPLMSGSGSNDRSLERWSNVIIKKRGPEQ